MSIQPSYSYTQEDMEWMEGLYDDCETTDATKCDADFTEKLQLFVDESDEHDETDEHMGEPPLLEDEVSLAAEANDSTESPSFFESEELLSDDVSVPPVDDDVSVQSILDRYESQSTPNEEEWFKEVTPPHNHISIEIGKVLVTKKVAKIVARKAAKKVANKFTKKSKKGLLDRRESLFTPLPKDNTYRYNDTSFEIGKMVVTEIVAKKGTKKRTFDESLDNIGKRCEELFEVYKKPSTIDRTTSPIGEGTDQSSAKSTTAAALTESIDTVLAVPHGFLQDTTSNINLEPVNDIVSEEENRMYGNKYARFFVAEDDDHYDGRHTTQVFYRRPKASPFTCEPLPPRWVHPRQVTLDGHDGF